MLNQQILKSIFLATMLSTTSLSGVTAKEAVIGLSPNQPPSVLKAQVNKIIAHVAKTVDPGEKAWIFDAKSVRLLGVFAVPDKSVYANPKAKLQANKKLFGALKRFMDGAKAIPGREAAIDLSSFFKTLRRNYPASQRRDLIIIGSPIANIPKESSLSMNGARVPNNGHIIANTGVSSYGASGLPGSLNNYQVYFGDIAPDWSVSTAHAYHVERFWTLLAEAHGGKMAYFGSDLETLFTLVENGTEGSAHEEPLVSTDKLEMLHFAPKVVTEVELYKQKPEEQPAPESVWRNAKNVRLGITWDCNSCDFDLYVRPTKRAKLIYFEQASTDQGRLYKDFLSSPTTGFETVELNGSIDLSQVAVGINFYGGKTSPPSVKGELRIAIEGKVWVHSFRFDVKKGNKGRGANEAMNKNRAPNKYWHMVNPMMVVTNKSK